MSTQQLEFSHSQGDNSRKIASIEQLDSEYQKSNLNQSSSHRSKESPMKSVNTSQDSLQQLDSLEAVTKGLVIEQGALKRIQTSQNVTPQQLSRDFEKHDERSKTVFAKNHAFIQSQSPSEATILGKLGLAGIVMVDEEEDCLSLNMDAQKMNSSSQKEPNMDILFSPGEQQSGIFAWGINAVHQIGDIRKDWLKPGKINFPFLTSISLVACGEAHTLFLTEDARLFSIGSNSHGQLGLKAIQKTTIHQPAEIVINSERFTAIACGQHSSYVLTEAASQNLYSWGANEHRQLGVSSDKDMCYEPHQVAYGGQVQQLSAGYTHAGFVGASSDLFLFGSCERGQLGHSHGNFGQVDLKVKYVSCGSDYTICLTEECELLVSGALPFDVDGKTCLNQFEQLAKFEKTVFVSQIESTLFTTILAKLPGEDRTELFMWGETPLGTFQEPTSLNQLIAETSEDQQFQLDIMAVKNGPHFCVFVERLTGFTFQLGAENLQAVSESNAVCLTELKDAFFADKDTFACGSAFVIGQSKTNDPNLSKMYSNVNKFASGFTSAAKSCLSEIKSQGLQEEASSPILEELAPVSQDKPSPQSKFGPLKLAEVSVSAEQIRKNSISLSKDLLDESNTIAPSIQDLEPAKTACNKSPEKSTQCKLMTDYSPINIISPPAMSHNHQQYLEDTNERLPQITARTNNSSPLMRRQNVQTTTQNPVSTTSSHVVNQITMSNHLRQSSDLTKGNYELMLRDALDQSKNFNGNEYTELESMRGKLEKSRREYKRLLQQLDEDQDEVISLRNLNRKLLGENNSLQQKLIEFQLNQQDELRKSRASFTAHVQPCQCAPKLTNLQAQIEMRGQELYELNKQLGCVTSENEELKNVISEQQKSQDDHYQVLQLDFEREKQSLENKLNSQLYKCEGDLRDCQDDLQDCQGKLRDCQDELQDSQGKLQDCQADLALSQQILAGSQLECTKLEGDMVLLEQKETEWNEINARSQETQQKVQMLQEQVQSKSEVIQRLHDQYQAQQSENSQQTKALKTELEATKKQLKAADQALEAQSKDPVASRSHELDLEVNLDCQVAAIEKPDLGGSPCVPLFVNSQREESRKEAFDLMPANTPAFPIFMTNATSALEEDSSTNNVIDIQLHQLLQRRPESSNDLFKEIQARTFRSQKSTEVCLPIQDLPDEKDNQSSSPKSSRKDSSRNAAYILNLPQQNLTSSRTLQVDQRSKRSPPKGVRSSSRLRAPTPIQKSDSLQATLMRIEKPAAPDQSQLKISGRTNRPCPQKPVPTPDQPLTGRLSYHSRQTSQLKNSLSSSQILRELQTPVSKVVPLARSKSPLQTSRASGLSSQSKLYTAPKMSTTPKCTRTITPRSYNFGQSGQQVDSQKQQTRIKYSRASHLDSSSIAEEPQKNLPAQIQPPKHPNADSDRLNSKLKIIQSNKELLERKIQEYERKLKRDCGMNAGASNENANSLLSQDSGKSKGSTSRRSTQSKHLAKTLAPPSSSGPENRGILRETQTNLKHLKWR